MVQQIVISVIDDLDGSEADGTVQFGLDGKPLEIDLSAANAARLRDVLAPYIAVGSRVDRGGARAGQRRADRRSVQRRPDGPAIRRWAKEHGYDVDNRGRIPALAVAAYDARVQAPPAERGGVAPSEASPAADRRAVDPLAFSSEVRRWAAANGHQVAPQGRMSAGVVAAYRAAAGGTKSGRSSARRRSAAPSFSG